MQFIRLDITKYPNGQWKPWLQLIAMLLPKERERPYNAQQPWVKGFHGETTLGAGGGTFRYPEYLWIDQEIKKEITGK